MVFSSLLFIYLFLPLCLVSYLAARKLQTRNIILLCFSLFFYAFSGPKYLILLLGMVFVCWFSAVKIDQSHTKEQKRFWLILCLVLSLGTLGVFKYTGFFLSGIQAVFHFPKVIPNIVLPIGISFYTFQLISYVIDVYWGQVAAQKKYWMLLLYASLFHQCIAGPIVRYSDVANELQRRRMRTRETWNGVVRFSIGLAKKSVLANHCAKLADQLWPLTAEAVETANPLALIAGTGFYMLQIYLDFSAYSDMAIGMGQMIGIHYLENFNYPYMSTSVTEFWRRWHMSLGSFFRDYVYIPLGGNRCSKARNFLNLFIVWFLTGFWHGANVSFILWGLYFFVFLVIEKSLKGKLHLPRVFGHIYLLVVAYFGWILFKAESVGFTFKMIKGIFGGFGNAFTSLSVNLTLKSEIFFIMIAILAVTPLPAMAGRWFAETYEKKKWAQVILVLFPVVLLLLSTISLAGDSYNPFLYFQF